MTHLKNRFRLFVALMLLPILAQAQSTGVSGVMSTFQSVTQGWYTSIFSDALGLFGMLFGVEIVWMVTKWLITGKDVHEIFSSFIKKLITIGFFYTILLYASQWVPMVINGFKTVAVSAAGEPITTVGDIIMTGIRAFILCIEGGPASTMHNAGTALSDLWNLNLSGAATAMGNAADSAITTALGVNTLAGILVGFILILSFTYVVLELVAVQLEGMIVMSVGVIMLGFGGLSFTTKFVESYMQYALAVGVRLMVITLWASFIEWKVDPLIKTTLTTGNAGLEAYGVVLVLALLVAWLTKKLPGFASSILSGQSTLSGGELYKAVKDGAIAGAAVVAGVATGGVALAGAEAAGAMGATQGAAGSAGAGAMSAGTGASGGAAATVPAPPPPSSAPSGGTSAPSVPPSASGTAAPSSPKAPASQAAAPSAQKAAAAENKASPASHSQATSADATPAADEPASSGMAAPAGSAPSTPAGTVDHRPAAPNEQITAGSAPAGVPAPAAGTTGSGSGLEAVKGAFDQTQKTLHGAHDIVSPGEASHANVSAPSLNVKHLSD